VNDDFIAEPPGNDTRRKSEDPLCVLVVHLIVDAFLFAAILGHYYPGFRLLPF